jgi:hypothetical protein
MANALHTAIPRGSKIVLTKEAVFDEYQSLEWRTVEAMNGAGLFPFTVGSKIEVKFQDGDRCMIDGDTEIDIEATKQQEWMKEKENPS